MHQLAEPLQLSSHAYQKRPLLHPQFPQKSKKKKSRKENITNFHFFDEMQVGVNLAPLSLPQIPRVARKLIIKTYIEAFLGMYN